jgi:1-phosphatidylinositol-4-phosphate 5-kinase
LTPSAKYDFKFKDYAPWVFRELREDHFHLDPADYLLSLTAQYILSELGSPGKSGSFFYFSRDYRFIIKTIRHSEHKFLRSILKRYHAHVRANPHTLLSRFYGLHRVKLPRGRKIHFVIMNNLFPAHKDIHETYDLKGSTVGRIYPEERARENPRAVLKDLNWIERGKELAFGPEKRALLTEQLRRDAEFLKELQVMDYSLLVGIHNMQRGNRDNVRRNTLRVFSPPDVHVPPQPHAHVHGNPHRRRTVTSMTMTPEPPHVVRRAMHDASRNMNKSLKSVGDGLLPEEDTGDRQHFLFSQDEGGLRATDEQNEPLDTVYYLGVIDILTPYGFVKKFEHIWKGMSADRVRATILDGMLILNLVCSIRLVRCRLLNMRIASLRLCALSCAGVRAARGSRPSSRCPPLTRLFSRYFLNPLSTPFTSHQPTHTASTSSSFLYLSRSSHGPEHL